MMMMHRVHKISFSRNFGNFFVTVEIFIGVRKSCINFTKGFMS